MSWTSQDRILFGMGLFATISRDHKLRDTLFNMGIEVSYRDRKIVSKMLVTFILLGIDI